MISEFIVGRNAQSSLLQIIVNGRKQDVPAIGKLPLSISEQHLKVQMLDSKTIVVTNLDVDNDTYVNGRNILKKKVCHKDIIELGSDHFCLKWDYIDKIMPRTVDIRHLRDIWNDYENRNMECQVAERKFNTLRSVTGILSMCAVILGFVAGGGPFMIFVYVIIISIMIASTISAYKKAETAPAEARELKKDLEKRYVCPHCGHFLGMQSYDVLSQNDKCPYCKSIYLK